MRNGKMVLQGLLCFILVFSLILPLSGCGSPPPAAPEPDTLSMVQVLSSSGLADTAWPKFRHNAQNTGRSPYTGPQTPELKWSFATGDAVRSSPAIGADGSIYIVSYDENLYAIDPDGTQRWSFHVGSVGGYGLASPAIGADGTVYIGSGDGNLHAIEPNGTEKWRFASDGRIDDVSPVIDADGTIYFGSTNGTFYAVNPDGTEKWSVQTSLAIRSSAVIATDGTMYFCATGYSGEVFAVNADGTVKWTFDTEGRLYSSPAVGADGTIYVGTTVGHHLHAINPDGTEKWGFTTESSVISSPGIAADGTIYVGSLDGKLYAVDPDGTEKWSFNTGKSIFSSPAIGADGTIYVGSTNGTFYALNPDGTEKWSFIFGYAVFSSPAIGAGGIIYVGSFLSLHAIGEGAPETGLADSPWPTLRQNPQRTGRSPYIGPEIPEVKWSFATEGAISSSPAIGVDGTLYVGSDDNRLYAIDPDGSQKWSFMTDGAVASSPAIAVDGTIYAASNDGRLYAITQDGGERWQFTVGSGVSAPLIASDGTIYLGSYYENTLYAINPDGSQKWSFTGRQRVGCPAIGTDGTVYVGSSYMVFASVYDGWLYAIDPDGTEKWSFPTVGCAHQVPTVGPDGTVYSPTYVPGFISWFFQLYAVDSDGAEKWRRSQDGTYGASVGATGVIYSGSNPMYAINPDGTTKWTFYAGDYITTSPAVDADENIYVGLLSGSVVAMTADGVEKWRLPIGGRVNSGPAIGTDGTIYVGSSDGNLYAIGEAGPPSGAPIARASDISGQKDRMFSDTPYTVTVKYFDPDGRDDLQKCYLRLVHPDKELTMMWHQADDSAAAWAGEEGATYLTQVSVVSTPITEGGLEGYKLEWTFVINDQWPEVENAIDFGVFAMDDSGLESGIDVDNTKASFIYEGLDVILDALDEYERYTIGQIEYAYRSYADGMARGCIRWGADFVEGILDYYGYRAGIVSEDLIDARVRSLADHILKPEHIDEARAMLTYEFLSEVFSHVDLGAGESEISETIYGFVWATAESAVADFRNEMTSLRTEIIEDVTPIQEQLSEEDFTCIAEAITGLQSKSVFWKTHDPFPQLIREAADGRLQGDMNLSNIRYGNPVIIGVLVLGTVGMIGALLSDAASRTISQPVGELVTETWTEMIPDDRERKQFGIVAGTLASEVVGMPVGWACVAIPLAGPFFCGGYYLTSGLHLAKDVFDSFRRSPLSVEAIKEYVHNQTRASLSIVSHTVCDIDQPSDASEVFGTGVGEIVVRNDGPVPINLDLGPDGVDIEGAIARISVASVPDTILPGDSAMLQYRFAVNLASIAQEACAHYQSKVTLYVSDVQRLATWSNFFRVCNMMNPRESEAVDAVSIGSILDGWITQGEVHQTTFTAGPDTQRVVFSLSYGSTDLDLHVYDDQGNHVGFNYLTGEVESQIGGARYSGPDTYPEWIEVSGNPASRSYLVAVVATSTDPQGSYYRIAAREVPDILPILRVAPKCRQVDATPGASLDIVCLVSETGGYSDLCNVVLEATDLVHDGGIHRILASAIHFSDANFCVAAGTFAQMMVAVDVSTSVSRGTYTGTITATDDSGAVDESTLKLTIMTPAESVETATGTGTAFFTPSDGIIEDLQAVPPHSLPSVLFPHGMFDFRITGLTPGQTVTLTIEFPSPLPIGTLWWKYDSGRWYALPNESDNGDNIMVISLTDGGVHDLDDVPGQITDPGGAGNPMTVGWEGFPANKVGVVWPWIALVAAAAAARLLLLRRRRSLS